MPVIGIVAAQQRTAGFATRGSVLIGEGGDVVSAQGILTIAAVLAATEENDSILALAIPPNTADVTVTEADDTITADGASLPPISGSVDRIENADTIAATGEHVPPNTGTVSITETDDSISALGGVAGASNAVLREDGTYLLREDGGKIVHE